MAGALIGSVAYPDLRDHSAGLVVAERLMRRDLPPGVEVEDLSYNPIAVVQRLQDRSMSNGHRRIIFLASVPREEGRSPGTIVAYRWDQSLPDPEEIHRAVTDGVTGIIHLDNTLIIGRHFDALPPETFVVEIEPRDHDFGHELSPAVAAAVDAAEEIAVRIATEDAYAASLPLAGLGGPAEARARAG